MGIDRLTSKTKVFARAKPEDKLIIVKSLQRQNLVSAMTGDGVNDAPALNQADIGVAMGIQGTEVAKGASDMILMNDDFCSIVSAVEKGRVIYAGIQKFVAFIMSVHIAEVIQIFVCVVAGIPIMRTPLQILFLILVTDLPPSIALGMEPGDPSILKQMPRPKDEQIVLAWMWWSITINAALLSGIIIAIYLGFLWHYCEENVTGQDIDAYVKDGGDLKCLSQARTVAFIALVYAENIRAYIARSFYMPFWTNFLANWQMQKAIIMAQIALYIAVLIPGFNDKILGLNGHAIGIEGWIGSFLGPILTVVLCDAAKVITFYQNKWYQEKVQKKREEDEAERARQAALAAPPVTVAAQPAKAAAYSAPAPPAPAKAETTPEASKSITSTRVSL
jgi:magnesium-transporting ATPase (P-type)